jgi:hypothetical protein
MRASTQMSLIARKTWGAEAMQAAGMRSLSKKNTFCPWLSTNDSSPRPGKLTCEESPTHGNTCVVDRSDRYRQQTYN